MVHQYKDKTLLGNLKLPNILMKSGTGDFFETRFS
jgi:hypothetical protein